MTKGIGENNASLESQMDMKFHLTIILGTSNDNAILTRRILSSLYVLVLLTAPHE